MMRLGTRSSTLALAQAQIVAESLRARGVEVEVIPITTTGDRVGLPAAGGLTGVFVKELETALVGGRIDVAVHSLKDMPLAQPEGLRIGAVIERASPLDALVCRTPGGGLDGLRAGAGVGTSSPRRRAQLLHHRPDLLMRSVSGNVDTRLRKLEGGEFEAIVVALAGLQRLGRDDARAGPIPADICLPAPGQGAIAVEMRADDDCVRAHLAALDDAPTRACVIAERACLQGLGGGCQAAVGALARVDGGEIVLQAVVADAAGVTVIRGEKSGPFANPLRLGEELAGELLARGAAALIAAA